MSYNVISLGEGSFGVFDKQSDLKGFCKLKDFEYSEGKSVLLFLAGHGNGEAILILLKYIQENAIDKKIYRTAKTTIVIPPHVSELLVLRHILSDS